MKMRSTPSLSPPTSLCPPGLIIVWVQMAFTCWGGDAPVGSTCVSGTCSLGELSSTGDSRPYLKLPGQGDLTGIFRPTAAPSTPTGCCRALRKEAEQSAEKLSTFFPSLWSLPEGSCFLSLILEQEDAVVTKFRKQPKIKIKYNPYFKIHLDSSTRFKECFF